VAATLYTLLTGQPIHDFDGDGRPAIVLVLEGEPVPIQSRRKELPAGLAAAIHTALDRDPDHRFESCAAFAAAIKPFGA
jgi:serine/threonine-protein kinase